LLAQGVGWQNLNAQVAVTQRDFTLIASDRMKAETVATKKIQRSKIFGGLDAGGEAETRLRETDDAHT